MNGGGDVLARGAAKATFRQPDVSEKKYNEAVGDFDSERFLNGGKEKVTGKKETNKRGNK
jgi:hypothetical protein